MTGVRSSQCQTANRFAARQVVIAFSDVSASDQAQEPVGFFLCAGVGFTPEYLANTVGVGSEFMNDIGVSDVLYSHDVNGHSFAKSEFLPLFDYTVQRNTGNAVSFVRGFVPEQVCHISFPFMAGRTAMGISEIVPAVHGFRTCSEGAVSSIGVASSNRHPNLNRIAINLCSGPDVRNRNTEMYEDFLSCFGLKESRNYLILIDILSIITLELWVLIFLLDFFETSIFTLSCEMVVESSTARPQSVQTIGRIRRTNWSLTLIAAQKLVSNLDLISGAFGQKCAVPDAA